MAKIFEKDVNIGASESLTTFGKLSSTETTNPYLFLRTFFPLKILHPISSPILISTTRLT